jgi:hypothetical protein
MSKQATGALAPRIPFWDFATRICGLGQPDSKVQFMVAQRAIWKSVDRRVALTREEVAAYRELTGKPPWKVGSKPPHFIAQTLCRGGGKTLLLATIAVYEATTNSYEAQPGETVAVVALAPRLKQSRDLMRYAKAHFERPTLAPLLKRSVSEEIELVNGRLLRCQAVDKSGGAARGPTYICALFDESAFLNHDGLIIDEQQWQAVLAGARGVADFRGVLSSTPNGKSGFFWETFDSYFSKQDSPWEVFQGPVDFVRPDMDRGLLQEFMRSDPEAYKREFECDFSAGTGASTFFNAGQVEAAIMQGITNIEPSGPTASYACAVDPSGGKNDTFTVTVLERLDDGTIRQCLARGWDPKETPLTVHEIAKEIRDLVAPFGVRTVSGDVFGGSWVSEAFAAVGLTYEVRGFNAQLKLQRAAALRESFAVGRLHLLDVPKQTRELCLYEQRTLPSGAVTCGHPNTKDGSDDYLDSLGLAHWELLGNIAELHPPAGLLTRDKADKDKLYAGGHHPGYHRLGGRLAVTGREIAELGPGPEWICENAFKHWQFALWSLGELATHAAIAPVQLMCHFGRDTVLQHCWMRWILATASEDREILELGDFPSIPAWREIKRRVSECGRGGVVSFGTLLSPRQRYYSEYVVGTANSGQFFEENWPPDLLKLSQTRAWVPTCPPWTKPRREWGVFPENFHAFSWTRDQEWAPRIESIFKEADFERYLAKKKLEQQRADRGVALDLSSFFGRTI